MKTRAARRRLRPSCTQFRTILAITDKPRDAKLRLLNRGTLAACLSACNLGTLAQADHVGKQAISAGHALGQFAIESIRVIDVHAFPITGIDEAALLRFLSGIVGFEQGLVMAVPRLQEFRAAFFHPAVEVFSRDPIRPGEDWIGGIENFHFGMLVGYFFRVRAHLVWIW